MLKQISSWLKQDQWLREGDRVELEIEALGKLGNTSVRAQSGWSILQRKKGAATAPSK